MNIERDVALIGDLLKNRSELDHVEFKDSNANPVTIGELISAISNCARLQDKHTGYVVWGVVDQDRSICGTTFSPHSQVVQRQPLEFWLAQRLSPSVNFSFKEVEHPRGRIIVLEIPAATTAPVEFDRQARIRIGSSTPRLSDYPERLIALWNKLRPYSWERGAAMHFVDGDTVLSLIDYASYFDLTKQSLPDNRNGIFVRLAAERLIEEDVGGRWNITNMGAILFAKDLSAFGSAIARKAVRFVVYETAERQSTIKSRREEKRGYAAAFRTNIDYLDGLLPRNEHIGKAFRSETPIYPAIALRELLANALIHQDMTISGMGPLVELFPNRLEITNPGVPLIEPNRFIDLPPRSRNEALASLMRRMAICEEQGTGIDKVIGAVELFQLPAPDFQVEADATRVVLSAPRSFASMTVAERIRACYQHASLRYVAGDKMKNSTLRDRFGIPPRNAAQVSVVISKSLEQGLIRSADPERPQAAYVPYWA